MKYFYIPLIAIILFITSCKNEAQESSKNEIPHNGFYKGLVENVYAEGVFKVGKKDGCWIEYTFNEQIRKITNYKDGKKDGLFVEITRAGYLASQKYYKNDKLDGLSMEFILGKKVLHSNYKNGLLHGEYKSFYEDTRRIRSAFSYAHGKKDGVAAYYYENGKRMARYNYKDDVMHGLQTTYYDNGNLMSKENYNMAIKEGVAEEYNEDGKLAAKGAYMNDSKFGVWEYFDKDGKVIRTEEF